MTIFNEITIPSGFIDWEDFRESGILYELAEMYHKEIIKTLEYKTCEVVSCTVIAVDTVRKLGQGKCGSCSG